MYSDPEPAPAVQLLGRPDVKKYPSRTLVLENIHARTTPAAILQLLARRAGVDPYVLQELRIRNVIKRGRVERHAFLDFWRLQHAIWVHGRLGGILQIQCPRPRPGEVGQVMDESGSVVCGNGLNTISNADDSDEDMDRYILAPSIKCHGKNAAVRAKTRFYTHVRVEFWKPYVGKADPACLSKQGWECAECGLPNYEKWEFCYRCGVERPWSENIFYRPADMLGDDEDEHHLASGSGNRAVIPAYKEEEDETIDMSL